MTSHIEVFENSSAFREMTFVRNIGIQTQVLEDEDYHSVITCLGNGISLDHKGNMAKRLPYIFYPYLSSSLGYSYRGARSLEDLNLSGLLGGKEAMRSFFQILCPNNEVRIFTGFKHVSLHNNISYSTTASWVLVHPCQHSMVNSSEICTGRSRSPVWSASQKDWARLQQWSH